MRRVAIVDDSPDVRALWRAELERSGEFEVCAEGDDGRQAAEIALTHQPDVMLLDLSMPGLGGMHALPMVLSASPGTRVVILSAMGRNQFSRPALSLGACAFIEKHVPTDSLVARLHEALGERAGSGRVASSSVLVVEPDHRDRPLVQYLLDWLGHGVLFADDGTEALRIVAARRVSAVLASDLLPDMTAAELATRMRRAGAPAHGVPVIALHDADAGQPLHREGVAGVLARPIEAEALRAVLAVAAPTEPTEDVTALVNEEFLLALRERIGANTLQEIVTGFADSTRERMGLLRCAVDVGDTDWIMRLTHQICGSARSLAAPRLAEEAHDLERCAATASTNELRAAATRLHLTVDDTIATLIAMDRSLPAPRDEVVRADRIR